MKHALVTGATGFIGFHLVDCLIHQGVDVTCLVRPTSDKAGLQRLGPRLITGDVADGPSISRCLSDCDAIFNLAGTTKALRPSGFRTANIDGPKKIAEAAASLASPPVLVHVSSLAAAGPSGADRPRVETDPPSPVSDYGKSKLAGEHALQSWSQRLPISVVRPPIVLGPGDRDGFEMFRMIADWKMHLVPTLNDSLFSVIHAADLAEAMLGVALRGHRLSTEEASEGIYFAAAEETPTYAELGQRIGDSLGIDRVQIVRIPTAMTRVAAAGNQWISRLRRRPHIFNRDKIREAAAGSWTCRADRLTDHTGFRCKFDLQQRIQQTADWYCEQGWLRPAADQRRKKAQTKRAG